MQKWRNPILFFFRITSNFSSLRILLSFHALRPHKPCGLLGTGEEWDREREHSPASLFTRPLGSEDPSKANMVLNVHRNLIRLIEDWEKGEKGVLLSDGGRLYTYRYTVTTRMTSALRWATMRAILMFRDCEGQSHETVSTDHNFWRERRAEADSNRGHFAYQPNALPLGQTGSQDPSHSFRPDITVMVDWGSKISYPS